ncbi:MAG: hypothetical protein DRN30_01790 [Thermoplasmata archaeon]|nr:ABC transporter permease [Euryarchaeota archaeon]RLF66626.1 MAG: hypothetical protein DRN30_01790 [Thermoplasmata archaeon]
MRSDLITILKKELRIIKRRDFILGIMMPILILYIIGNIVGTGVKSSVEEITSEGINVIVICADPAPENVNAFLSVLAIINSSQEEGVKIYNIRLVKSAPTNTSIEDLWRSLSEYQDNITALINRIYVIGEVHSGNPPEDIIRNYLSHEADVVIYVPENFTWDVLLGKSTNVYTYYKSPEDPFSMFGNVKSGAINQFITLLGKTLNYFIIAKYYPGFPPNFVYNPIVEHPYTYYKGKIIAGSPEELFGTLGAGFIIPIMMFLLATYATTTAASNMGEERENKTLETLLTLPVRRRNIVIGKVLGMIVVATIMAVFYIFGLVLYMKSLMNSIAEENISIIGLTGMSDIFTVKGALLLGASIVFTAGIGAMIGLIIGSFSDSVRTASTISSLVVMPLALPAFFFMYVPIRLSDPKLYLLMLDPFMNTIIIMKGLFANNIMICLISISYLLGIFLALLYVTARLFNSERVILGGFKKKSILKRSLHMGSVRIKI